MSAALKTWQEFFDLVNRIESDPSSEAYANGRAEAQRALALAREQLERYKKNMKKFHPRNGDIDFHLHAFRHGFNQYLTELRTGGPKPKSAKPSSEEELKGGLYADVLDNSSLKKYSSAALRSNEPMLNAGREFAGTMLSYEGVNRANFLSGFRAELDAVTSDMFPPIVPSAASETPSREESESEAASSSSSSATPKRLSEEPGPKTPVVELPGEPYAYDTSIEIETPADAPSRVVFFPFQRRLLTAFTGYRKAAAATLKKLTQAGTLNAFENADKVGVANATLKMTHFDFAKYAAQMLRNANVDARTSALVTDVIKVESYQTFVRLLDADMAFTIGYGSGEAHHRSIREAYAQLVKDKLEAEQGDDEGMTGEERDAFIDVNGSAAILQNFSQDDAGVVIDIAFVATINKYFATWASASKAIKNETLLDTKSSSAKLLNRLQPTSIITEMFGVWLTRRGEKPSWLVEKPRDDAALQEAVEAHPLHAGFLHFADAGVLSAVDFLRAFVRNGRSTAYLPQPMRYPLWLPSFVWYVLGWKTYMEAQPPMPTMHVESLTQKVTLFNEVYALETDEPATRYRYSTAQVLEIVPGEAILDEKLEEREVGKALEYLDPDQIAFVGFSRTKGTAIDIMYGLIGEGFPVDPETAEVMVPMPVETRFTWQMRVMQNWLVFSINARVLRPWISDNAPTLEFQRKLPKNAARELRFYQMLGEYTRNFSRDVYKQLMKKYGRRLMAFPKSFSEYTKYAMMLDHQISAWFERCRKTFDESNFADSTWPVISKFWELDGFPVSQDNVLYDIIKTACARSIRDEKMAFLRRVNVIKSLQYPFDLPFSDQSDLMLSELIATVLQLHSAFTPETTEMIRSARAIAQGAGEEDSDAAEANTKTLSALLFKLWPSRATDAPEGTWLTDAAQDELLERVASVSLDQLDMEFFNKKHDSSALLEVARASSLDALSGTPQVYANLLISAYLAEMYTNCDVVLSNIIERRWESVFTFGDVYAHKAQLVSSEAGLRAYRGLINALNKADIAGASASSSDQEPKGVEDDEEDEDDDGSEAEEAEEEDDGPSEAADTDETPFSSSSSSSSSTWDVPVVRRSRPAEPEPAPAHVWDVPVVRRSRPASSVPVEPEPFPEVPSEPTPKRARDIREEPAPEPEALFNVAAMEVARGPMFALVSQARGVVRRSIMTDKQDYSYYQRGETAGGSFAQDLIIFTERNFPETQRLAKYADIRAYALSQLTNIYDELSRPTINDSIWKEDSENPVAVLHDAELIRKLLAVTEVVANQIFSFEGKKHIYMSGFIHQYEVLTRESIEHFATDELAGGGGRKEELLGASISMGEDLSFGELARQSKLADDSSVDAQVGRAAAEGFANAVDRYSWKQRIPYHRALSRVYRATVKAYSDMRNAPTGDAAALGYDIAAAILSFTGDKPAFYRGMVDVLLAREPKPVTLTFDYSTEFQNTESVIASISSAKFNNLEFKGAAFTDAELAHIVSGVRGNAFVTSLLLIDTSVRDLAAVFAGFPELTDFLCATPLFTHKALKDGLATQLALNQLRTFIFDVDGGAGDHVSAVARYLRTATHLRDVEIYMPNFSSVAADKIRDAVAASHSITAFFAPNVYPLNDGNDQAVTAALKRNRTAAILVGAHAKGVPSRRKAQEMLAHGEVRGHPLTEKQHNYFELLAHGGHPRMNK